MEQLIVSPGSCEMGPEEPGTVGQPCTILATQQQADGWTETYAALRRLDTGQTIETTPLQPTIDGTPTNEYLVTTPAVDGQPVDLATGAPYEFTRTAVTLEHDWCSQPVQSCHIPYAEETTTWRFRYTAGATLAINAYRAPTARITHVTVAKKPHAQRVITGQLAGNTLQSDYNLTAWRPKPHTHVQLYRKPVTGGRWRRVATALTRNDGTFRLRALAPGGKRCQWRLTSTASSTTGSATRTFTR